MDFWIYKLFVLTVKSPVTVVVAKPEMPETDKAPPTAKLPVVVAAVTVRLAPEKVPIPVIFGEPEPAIEPVKVKAATLVGAKVPEKVWVPLPETAKVEPMVVVAKVEVEVTLKSPPTSKV